MIAGVPFRVVPGRKAPGDLRVEWGTSDSTWTAVPMSAAFLLTDFFCENEDWLAQFNPHWRYTGTEWFLKEQAGAARLGWKQAAERVDEQRKRREELG